MGAYFYGVSLVPRTLLSPLVVSSNRAPPGKGGVVEVLVIVLLSLFLVPLVAFTSGALRIALGLAFVLFFPRYTLIAALFPRKGSLDDIERFALSFGLGIAVALMMAIAGALGSLLSSSRP